MGFRTGAYATCWSVEPGKGSFTKVRLSVSKKNRETGAYDQDFSGFCTFIGNAHAAAATLKERDRIKLGDVDVSSTFDKERGREYINFKVFSFEKVIDQESSSADDRVTNAVDSNPVESEEENCPF